MRNFIRAALVIGTLATPMIASAGADAPKTKTTAKAPAKKDAAPTPAKDDKAPAADAAKKDDKAAPAADATKKDDAKTPAKDVKAAPKKPAATK